VHELHRHEWKGHHEPRRRQDGPGGWEEAMNIFAHLFH
jgi:hypothetical protein